MEPHQSTKQRKKARGFRVDSTSISSFRHDDPDSLPKPGSDSLRMEVTEGRGHLHIEMSSFVRWLAEIKEVTRTYEMSVDIDVTWKASAADMACTDKEWREKDWKPSISPDLVVQNAYTLKEDMLISCAHGGLFELRRDSGMVFFRKRYTGEFFAPLDLRSFPFDIQELPLVIELSFLGTDAVWMMPPSSHDYTVWFNREFSVLSNFITNAVCSEYDNRGRFSRFKQSIYLERDWMAYLYRVILPVCIISGSSLLVFSLNPILEVEGRLGLGITLMLTLVAFEFTLAQDLPKDPTLSILDKYVKASFVFLVAVLMAVAFVGWRSHEEDNVFSDNISDVDWAFFALLCVLWTVLQVWLVAAGTSAFWATGRNIAWGQKRDAGSMDAVMVMQSKDTVKGASFSKDAAKKLGLKERAISIGEEEFVVGGEGEVGEGDGANHIRHLKTVR